MVKNVISLILLESAFDIFDEHLFVAFEDSESKSFTALLGEVGFSHNTLLQHLQQLMAEGIVLRDKWLIAVLGDPNFLSHCS
jgi:hypothetical protein